MEAISQFTQTTNLYANVFVIKRRQNNTSYMLLAAIMV